MRNGMVMMWPEGGGPLPDTLKTAVANAAGAGAVNPAHTVVVEFTVPGVPGTKVVRTEVLVTTTTAKNLHLVVLPDGVKCVVWRKFESFKTAYISTTCIDTDAAVGCTKALVAYMDVSTRVPQLESPGRAARPQPPSDAVQHVVGKAVSFPFTSLSRPAEA